jgi:hypothetical protein
MSGFDDMVRYAQQDIIAQLCSGKDFRGLGPSADYILMGSATTANENAVALYGKETARTPALFNELKVDCREQFVNDILGFGTEPKTPQEAAKRLVEKIFDQYISWAKLARDSKDPS